MTFLEVLALALPLVLAIVCHEVAHGWVARLLGDPTAAAMGRLTLNPLAHVDPVGTVILPGALALAHLPVFGWARPVPIDARYFANPRRGMMLVALAGPAINVIMAVAAAVGLGLMARFIVDPANWVQFLAENLRNFMVINLSLALFNMLPVPPFDGSHVAAGLLPQRAAVAYGRLRRIGIPLMLVVLVVLPRLLPGFQPIGWLLGPPLDLVTGWLVDLARLVQGGGNPS